MMLDTLEWQRNPIGPEPVFLTEMEGTSYPHMENGTVFTIVRPEEKTLILDYLGAKVKPTVLDFGCGVGRHANFIRQERPEAEIWGVESEPRLLEICRNNHDERFVADGEIVNKTDFDMALLLGNNACIFGNEGRTQKKYKWLGERLRSGGYLLGEFSSLGGGDHHAAELKISYPGQPNPSVPFQWFFMSEPFVKHLLLELGFEPPAFRTSRNGRARFFIAQKS